MKREHQPLTFGREKRLLLGVLAFLTPLPLPFNEVTGWVQLAVYWLVLWTLHLACFVVRVLAQLALRGRQR